MHKDCTVYPAIFFASLHCILYFYNVESGARYMKPSAGARMKEPIGPEILVIKNRSPYLPIHLAAVASSYSNSCGLDCTDSRVTGSS